MRPALFALAFATLLSRSAQAIPVRAFDDPGAALAAILDGRIKVAAFGEYHQTNATSGIPSAIGRFTNEMLGVLGPRMSDLIVETMITNGNCGEVEKQAAAEVEQKTERPASTGNEVITLLERAKKAGARPHILELSCVDWKRIHPSQKEGDTDFEQLLLVITEKLHAGIRDALRRPPPPGKVVCVYGGARHNDLHPEAVFREISFGPAVAKETKGKYLEIDLYVPEYVEHDEEVTKEPWYAEYKKGNQPGKTMLIERARNSWAIVFPRASDGKSTPPPPSVPKSTTVPSQNTSPHVGPAAPAR